MQDNNPLVTRDTLFKDDLICYQHTCGYRFSIDSVLLAHFVKVKNGDTVLDLGTGSGIINLIIFYRNEASIGEISGIEAQLPLANLARKNYVENNLQSRGKIYDGDIRQISSIVAAESFDVVTSNPPFYPGDTGRLSKGEEARLARHLINGGLEDFLSAAFYAIKNRGTAFFIYPAERMCEFITVASRQRLEVKRLRPVYSYPGASSAKLVLFECVKNGRPGVLVQDNLYVYTNKNGAYSGEVKKMYEKRSSPDTL